MHLHGFSENDSTKQCGQHMGKTCDQTHTLSSLENILHYLIQYNCQRITSENWKLFSIRGHTPTALFPIHKISFSSRLSHVLLDRVYNKVHKIVLYFTFCVQYCARYLIEKPYSAREQPLCFLLILCKRKQNLLEVILWDISNIVSRG